MNAWGNRSPLRRRSGNWKEGTGSVGKKSPAQRILRIVHRKIDKYNLEGTFVNWQQHASEARSQVECEVPPADWESSYSGLGPSMCKYTPSVGFEVDFTTFNKENRTATIAASDPTSINNRVSFNPPPQVHQIQVHIHEHAGNEGDQCPSPDPVTCSPSMCLICDAHLPRGGGSRLHGPSLSPTST